MNLNDNINFREAYKKENDSIKPDSAFVDKMLSDLKQAQKLQKNRRIRIISATATVAAAVCFIVIGLYALMNNNGMMDTAISDMQNGGFVQQNEEPEPSEKMKNNMRDRSGNDNEYDYYNDNADAIDAELEDNDEGDEYIRGGAADNEYEKEYDNVYAEEEYDNVYAEEEYEDEYEYDGEERQHPVEPARGDNKAPSNFDGVEIAASIENDEFSYYQTGVPLADWLYEIIIGILRVLGEY
ncbi:MAG: hypothetical protein FWF94_04335 [Oscillospiraceae bacterium]|nr:hypothetical protein [Oscillospiraceae bacterium]